MLHFALIPTSFSAPAPKTGQGAETAWAVETASCPHNVVCLSPWPFGIFFGPHIFIRHIHYQIFLYLFLLACPKRSDFFFHSFMGRFYLGVSKLWFNCKMRISVSVTLSKPADLPSDLKSSMVDKEDTDVDSRPFTYIISFMPPSGEGGNPVR